MPQLDLGLRAARLNPLLRQEYASQYPSMTVDSRSDGNLSALRQNVSGTLSTDLDEIPAVLVC